VILCSATLVGIEKAWRASVSHLGRMQVRVPDPRQKHEK